MGKPSLNIDPISFNGWLVSNIISSVAVRRSAGEQAGVRPNGEDWLVIDPKRGLQFIEPEKATLSVNYVVLDIIPTAWLDESTKTTKMPPQISLSATIANTYHKEEAKDFLLIGKAQQNDIDTLLASKPSHYKLLVERSLYKAMVVHAIGVLMNGSYGYRLAGFETKDAYRKALKDPASDIYLKLMRAMKQAELTAKDVAELREAALSDDKQCYEMIPLLDHYQRSELKEADTAAHVAGLAPTGANRSAFSR
ncbi:MAG: hypothetical protein LW823_01360 [Rickettsiales bacterium]|jgi:hypothetical protein|nr:hypothetical protein [Rickettsiales bacterium]